MKTLTKPKRKTQWQLQEAKAMFSEVVKMSGLEPQIITVHGKQTAVILSFEEYKRLTTPQQSIYEFFKNSPLYGIELELPDREMGTIREIDL